MARTVAAGTVALSITLYMTAMEVRSSATGVDIWWPPPYPWLWTVLLIALAAGVSWIFIELTAGGAPASGTDSTEAAPTDLTDAQELTVPAFQWERSIEPDGVVRLTNRGQLVEVTSIRGQAYYTRVDSDFSLPITVPQGTSVQLRVRTTTTGNERHRMVVDWRLPGQTLKRSHTFEL